MKFEFLNSIYYKSLIALYKLNIGADGRAKSLIIDAIFQSLVIEKDGLNVAILEMALETATDEWLDYWGNTFGVPRDYGEEDDIYRKRIIEEILTPKNTLEGIKIAAARKINKDHNEKLLPESIRIFEPWTELIKLDERGYLDGSGRLISYDYWIYSVIDISLPDSSHITPELIKYLNRVKAAGVKIAFSVAPRWGIITDADRALRDSHVYNHIYNVHCMEAKNANNEAFATNPDSRLDIIIDDLDNTILDGDAILEGRQIMFWEGIQLTRNLYGTGLIRNHLGGILSLEDYARILVKDQIVFDREHIFSMLPDSIKSARKPGKDNNESVLPDATKVFEPWTDSIKLDERGYLDGSGTLIHYEYWMHSVIDISTPDSSSITEIENLEEILEDTILDGKGVLEGIQDFCLITIGDAIELEEESFRGSRESEGRLTMTQKTIEIKTERIK